MMGHYFNPSSTLADKLEMAAASYELTQAIMPLVAYFEPDPKNTWAAMAQHEETLQARLLAYLAARPDIIIRGGADPSSAVRVPTISFTVKGRSSQSVVEAVEAISPIGIRWGHFFSKRLVEKTLGLEDDGVVRVSMVHYNTSECLSSLNETFFRGFFFFFCFFLFLEMYLFFSFLPFSLCLFFSFAIQGLTRHGTFSLSQSKKWTASLKHLIGSWMLRLREEFLSVKCRKRLFFSFDVFTELEYYSLAANS